MASAFSVFPEVFLCFCIIHVVFLMTLHLTCMLDEHDPDTDLMRMSTSLQRRWTRDARMRRGTGMIHHTTNEMETNQLSHTRSTSTSTSTSRRRRETHPIRPAYPDHWFQSAAYAVSGGRVIYFIAGVITPSSYSPYISLLASLSYLPLFALVTLHLWIRYEILYTRKFRNILKLQIISSRWKRLNWTWSLIMLTLFLSLTCCDLHLSHHDTSTSTSTSPSTSTWSYTPTNFPYTSQFCYKPVYADLNFIQYSHHAPYHVPRSHPNSPTNPVTTYPEETSSFTSHLLSSITWSIHTTRTIKTCIIIIGTYLLTLFYMIASIFTCVLGMKLHKNEILVTLPVEMGMNETRMRTPSITYTVTSVQPMHMEDIIPPVDTTTDVWYIRQRITWPTSLLWACIMSICLIISAIINTMSNSHPHVFFEHFRIWQSLYLSSEVIVLCIVARLSCAHTQILPPIPASPRTETIVETPTRTRTIPHTAPMAA